MSENKAGLTGENKQRFVSEVMDYLNAAYDEYLFKEFKNRLDFSHIKSESIRTDLENRAKQQYPNGDSFNQFIEDKSGGMLENTKDILEKYEVLGFQTVAKHVNIIATVTRMPELKEQFQELFSSKYIGLGGSEADTIAPAQRVRG